MGGTWVNFYWVYVPLASQSPNPIVVYSVGPIIDPILVTFGQICNFRDPNLVIFFFYELNHLIFLDLMKNTSLSFLSHLPSYFEFLSIKRELT